MIIPVHHILTSNLPTASTTAWEGGYTVAVNSSTGNAVPCDQNGSNNTNVTVGLSADKSRAAEAFEWVNRLSDAGQETRASGKLSFYHSGGEFFVDVDDSTITTPGGTAIDGVLDSGATKTAGTQLYQSTTDGHLASTQTGSDPVLAIILEATQELASGIPGEYEPGSSFALADDTDNRNWVKIKLNL